MYGIWIRMIHLYKIECNEPHFEIVDSNNEFVESFDYNEYSIALKTLKQLNCNP